MFVLLWLASTPAIGDSPADATIQDNGRTPLMTAARNGDNHRLEALIAGGADVNLANGNGGTAIMYAALSGRPETVSLLLAHHADVDAVAGNGWTALTMAAVKGHVDVARLLLGHGAEPNRADIYSWTPLMRAVYEKRPRIIKLLVEHDRTRVNQRGENGVTALHLAVLKADADAVKMLLGAGADPGIKDGSGRSALDFARQNNELTLLRLMNTGR